MMMIFPLLTLRSASLLVAHRGLPASRRLGLARCAFSTRSTVPDEPEEERFAEGAPARSEALAAALTELGFEDLVALRGSAEFRGSAARRTYNSFVYPKSAGALSNAEKPGRTATTAQQIAFLVREQRAASAEWLRNVDRAQAEVSGTGVHPLYVVLDNVRSAANAGNVLRAAEAAKAARVYLCGITPQPPDARLLKTAVGAAAYVPHEHCPSTMAAVRALQARGVAVWACETTSRSVPHTSPLPLPLALVFGNELIGVDTEVLAACDGVIEVRTQGVKRCSKLYQSRLPTGTAKPARRFRCTASRTL